MSIFAPADIAEFRAMQDDMAFSDAYRLIAQHEIARDSRNNRVFAWVVIEEGFCRLRATNRVETERIIADKVGWTNAVALDVPWDTMMLPEHRVMIGNREFHVNVVNREEGLGMNPIALCEERSH
jgi:hypothetical protein